MPGTNLNSNRRRKIWDARGLQCSIIGTCLSRTDIRKLAAKRVFGLRPDLDDHEIHSILVNRAGTKSDESRALHRILDNKYKTIITRFAKIKTEEELIRQWEEYLETGNIAGAYWAVMSHPALTNEGAFDIHGEIHMIAHDSTALYQKAKKQLNDSLTRAAGIEKQLEKERILGRDTQKALEETSKKLETAHAEQEQQNETIRLLEYRAAELEARVSSAETGRVVQEMKDKNDLLEKENINLKIQLAQLNSQLETLQKIYDLAAQTAEEVQEQNSTLLEHNQQLSQELNSLEDFLNTRMVFDDTDSPDCTNCVNEEECCKRHLDGKTVLYVGGQYKMVPRYKQLVEQYGGVFLHHDGGVEVSRHVLPRFLSRADAVLCPVDCVSHDACKCVKKMCKQFQKEYVMMRSSGLSSLAKSLQEIAQ